MNRRHPLASATAALLTRRQWLARSGWGLGGLLGAAALGNLAMPGGAARAADYRALVCVFLYGGNDGNNTVVPVDATRYALYQRARGALAIPQAQLLPLGSSGYGLHPALAALVPHWTSGDLATVFNVGPLAAPLTKAQYRAEPDNSPRVPESLFSHSHQQTLWQAGSASTLVRSGWGGRAAEALATTNPVISVGGNGLFGVSQTQAPLVVPGPGGEFGVYEFGTEPWRSYEPAATRAAALRALYAQTDGHALTDAFVRQQQAAFEITGRLGATVSAGVAGAPAAITSAFAPLIQGGKLSTQMASQLFQVAQLIAQRSIVRGDRQLFFAQLGGFDTHGGQVAGGDPATGNHADLLQQLGDALAAFQQAMTNLGMAEQVTAFTQSDFGRTLAANDSLGSDHAWGNHHLVLGGAVRGGTAYGRFPQLELGGPDDVGQESWERQGRWIPTAAVDQYAATLLRWLGADESQLDTILPNLRAFGAERSLGFL